MSDASTLLTVVGTPGDDFLIGTNGNDLLDGGDGFDQLLGLAGDDTLIGGTSQDQLDGGSGDDTYIFAIGDGVDAIREGALSPEVGGMDTVRLLAGYDPATTQLYRYGNDLVIRSPAGDEVYVPEHFGSYLDGSLRAAIERIVFADGTIWDAAAIVNRVASNNSNLPTEGNDTIGGTPWGDYIDAMGGNDTLSGGDGDDFLVGGFGDDRVFGGAGNDVVGGKDGNDLLAGGTGVDTLEGGAGDDTYLFNLGDGQDRIYDFPAPGESNRVVFGDGIAFADLHAYADYGIGAVVIDIGTGGDRLELSGALLDPYAGATVIDTYQFADGTLATADAVFGYGTYQQGKEFDDWLTGSQYDDSLYGNGGNDSLYGDSGNDILAGGQGFDWLSGGAGDDTYVFNRGDGMDIIDDFAFAPFEGNRVLFGEGITVDDLRLRIDTAVPSLEIAGTAGTLVDGLQFSNFNPLDPNAPRSVETFEFADGSTLSYDQLVARGFYVGGTEWSDYLIGSTLNDRIYGYGGDDTLVGMEGEDILDGGTGNDQLYGGAGSDLYVFRAGDGMDTVADGAGMPYDDVGFTDVVLLQGGYDPASTQLQRWGSDLVITNGQSGDQIRVQEHFGSYYDGNTRGAIEQITFSDGTVWDTTAINARIASGNSNETSEGDDTVGGTPWDDFLFGFAGNDTLSGGAGNDLLDGAAGNDRLFGGAGDDRLWDMEGAGNDLLAGGTGNDLLGGGAGNDTYLFNLGDGVDRINEMPAPGETNRVVFGEGIGFHDLRASYDDAAGEVVIDVGSNGDQLRLVGPYPDPYGPRAIDTFTFADGTVASLDALFGYGVYFSGTPLDEWMGGSDFADGLYSSGGNDWLYGNAGDDYLGGGRGSDWLGGGAGDDTYLFNVGDGVDSIDDYAGPGEGNRVLFGAGIAADDLRLRSDGVSAYLEIGTNGDRLSFSNFHPLDPNAPRSVETFELADGSTLSYEQLVARGFFIGGTEWNDALFGSDANDAMYGFGGDDLLDGAGGDDTLVGGAGNDQLRGGAGNDTYVFELGDGMDVIDDDSLPGEGDRVVFGAGISAGDLSLTTNGSMLQIHIGWAGDSLSLAGFDRLDPYGARDVENFEFADGSVLSYDQLLERAIAFTGTDFDDVLEGTNAIDVIFAGGGNDVVHSYDGDDSLYGDYTGQSGNDVLDGGAGNDFLVGSGGSDLLIGGLGDDSYQVESDGAVIVEYAGEGTDSVLSTVSYTLSANVEILRLAGYAISATGNELDNNIYGNNYYTVDNILDGGAGIDRMYGYKGNDTYIVDNASDWVGESAGEGVDTVISSVTYALSPNVENLVLAGTAAINGTGNDLDNAMTGNSADNMLFGGAGADTLQGGAGVDSLVGGLGGDSYVYGLGDGNDSVFELESAAGDVDKVLFGSGIGANDLTVTRVGVNGYDLQIAFAGSAETLTLWNWFNPAVPGQIEEFHFADGTVLTGQQVADLINSAPVVGQPLPDQLVLEDSVLGFTIPANSFVDPDGDMLSLTASLADGSLLPAWLQFDPATRTFAGTPGNAEVGSLDIRVVAEDPRGESVSGTFSLTVQNVNDAPVAAGVLPSQSGEEGQAFSCQIPADAFLDVDTVHGDVLTYSASLAGGSPLPAWLQFDAATRTFSGTPADGDAGLLSVAISATDSAGAVASGTFQLAIANTIQTGTDQADVLYGSTADDELYGLAGNDILRGQSGDDLLAGGTGNDMLYGGTSDPYDTTAGAGNDIYLFNPGDGQDTIVDLDTTAGNIDTIRFGAGIQESDVRFAGVNGDLVITIGTGGDQITVKNWFSPLSYWYNGYPETANRIERIEFADGTTIDMTARTDIVHTITGTDYAETINGGIEDTVIDARGGNDQLFGSAGADFLLGGAGADVLSGGSGDDLLQGGTGNDTLYGQDSNSNGLGNDTYVFNAGDGQDIIFDSDSTAGNTDTVRFGAGITLASLNPSRSGDNLVVTLSGGDSITVYGWYASTANRIETWQFDDGSVLTAAEIQAWADNVAPVVVAPIATQTATEDAPFGFAVPAGTFSDPNPGDLLHYSASLADGGALPGWLGFDAAAATFSGTPANGDVGSLNVRVTATDNYGVSTAADFVLAVQNTNDTPVLANAIADQVAAEGEAFSYQIAADAFSDVDMGDMLTYSATLADGSALPAWLSFDAASRTFSGNPADGAAGDYAIKVTATDGVGASVSDEFMVSVADAIATVRTGTSGVDTLQGTAFRDVLNGLGSNDTLYGYAGDDLLDGGSGSDTMRGGTGNDTYVVGGTGDVVVENADEGIDTVQSSISYTLGANVENLTLTGTSNRNATGNSLDNVLTGNSGANTLTGNAGHDTLDGGAGTDSLRGGTGNDTYVFARGYGADTIVENDATAGNTDTVAISVNAIDVVFAQSASNLLMTLHGGTDKLTVSNWYSGSQYQTEVIETADGQQLLNTQVDQLIQAMASFTASTGLTWDQAIDQRPEDVQAIVSAYWQPAA